MRPLSAPKESKRLSRRRPNTAADGTKQRGLDPSPSIIHFNQESPSPGFVSFVDRPRQLESRTRAFPAQDRFVLRPGKLWIARHEQSARHTRHAAVFGNAV